MKYLLGFMTLILLAGGAWYVMMGEKGEPLAPSDFSWVIEEAGDSEAYIPSSKVSLRVGGDIGKTYDVGIIPLPCFAGRTDFKKDEHELSQLICWFAGGGKEIGVFFEEGAYLVKEGDIDEGSFDIPSFRGNFKTLFTIER